MKKKIFKKFVVLTMLFTFVFSFSLKPKQAEAFGLEMTIAGAVASGFGLPVILVGAAAAVAIGGVIGTNWDSISAYGEKVIADLESKGIDPSTLIDEQNKTVTMSPDMINSAARAVDRMPDTLVVPSAAYVAMSDKVFSYPSNTIMLSPSITVPAGYSVRLVFDYAATGSNEYGSAYTPYTQYSVNGGSYSASLNLYTILKGASVSGHIDKLIVAAAATERQITFRAINDMSYARSASFTNVKYAVYETDADLVGDKTFNTADNFGMTADNVYQRELYANSLLAQNQVLTLNDSVDLTNATLEDVLSVQTGTYDETKTQTGILSNIWNTIKVIPQNIVAAGVAASAAINAKATDLWEDAGAIWTGLSDTVTGLKTDVDAKMSSLQDAMSGGIDNVRTGINDMAQGLTNGLDAVGSTVAGWGQNILTGIDVGNAAIAGGLTNVWTGVTEGVGAIGDGLTRVWERVGDIPAAIAAVPGDIVTSLTDLIVPTAAQTAENDSNMSHTKELLVSKFDWIRVPIEEIKSLYGQRKSFFDVSINIMGQKIVLIPANYAPTVAIVRNVMSGTMIMSTIIFIYRRIQPTDVI